MLKRVQRVLMPDVAGGDEHLTGRATASGASPCLTRWQELAGWLRTWAGPGAWILAKTLLGHY